MVSRELHLAEVSSALARSDPARAAIVDTTGTLSYGDLDSQADRVAGALERDGVGPGDRVAFLADAPAQCLTFVIGAARVGAVPVPLNVRLSPGEIGAILTDSQAAVLVADQAALAALEAEPGALKGLRRTVSLGTSADGDIASWPDWLSEPAAHRRPPDLTEVALQLYTSGTTIPEMCELWRLDADSRMLGVLPLFHIAGFGSAVGTLFAGGTLVLPADASAGTLLRTITEQRVTNLVLASVLLQRILEEAVARIGRGDPPDLSALRIVGYGAAPISQSTLRQAMEVLPCGLLQVYGLTECAGTISVLRPEEHVLSGPGAERLRSCGRAMDSLELGVLDPVTGDPVEVGEVGEIRIRSPRVMPGYWQAPEATRQAITDDGWLRTGDLGYQDGEGFLYLCDRLTDMIVTGGENVYPAEVEDVLAGHPAVSEVAVVGVPDQTWGERPIAVVVLAPGTQASGEQIISYARDHLAHFKCPASVDFTDALPRNATGKVLRRMVREPYWADRERRVN
jgi:acyl-CoA synthetase (AMP-forming)/AMP-acid ligase II